MQCLRCCGVCIQKCENKKKAYSPPLGQPMDYSNDDYWYFSEGDRKYAGFVPKGATPKCCGKCSGTKESKVDIFYVHPTTMLSAEHVGNMEIDEVDPIVGTLLGAGRVEDVLKEGASAFNAAGNVYCPKYRAINMHTYENGLAKDEQHDKAVQAYRQGKVRAYRQAQCDVVFAFEEFLHRFCTNERPFILAGHSQGAEHCMWILKSVIEKEEELKKRLVCVYAMGCQTGEDSAESPVMQNPTSHGGYLSWATVSTKIDFSTVAGGAPGGCGDGLVFPDGYLTKKVMGTNPLSWNSEDAYVGKDSNLGALIKDKIVPNFVGAKISNGHVQIDTSEDSRIPGMATPETNETDFHCADISFFWSNIRKNAVDRTEAWLKANPAADANQV